MALTNKSTVLFEVGFVIFCLDELSHGIASVSTRAAGADAKVLVEFFHESV